MKVKGWNEKEVKEMIEKSNEISKKYTEKN